MPYMMHVISGSKMLHGRIDTRDPDQAVAKFPGCLVTDSRNVYDKLTCEVASIKGAENEDQEQHGFW